MMTSDATSTPIGLPPGLVEWEWLAEAGAGFGVGRGVLEGRPVAVRMDPTGSQTAAELEVLATLDHPGLARLVDHGALPGGGRYLVRTWVEGEELGTWARGRDPREVGRALARSLPALEHLHRSGFVHGDIKASNLIVPAGDEPTPVITDFGLSGRAQSAPSEVAGSWFHLAPELLFGGPRNVASDLFAFGAMLHGLLTRPECSAAEFYGRFPREDFFVALGTGPEALPEWARDVVAGLVSREAGRRPRSAARVARTLAARLGLDDLDLERGPDLAWPSLRGHEAWLHELLATLESSEPSAPIWITLRSERDAEPLAAELAVQAALAGLPVARLDPGNEVDELATSRELDDWAVSSAERHAGRVVFAAVTGHAHWRGRALSALALAANSGEHDRPPARLLVCSAAPVAAPTELWSQRPAPVLEAESVEDYLAERLAPEPPARLAKLAGVLVEAAEGSSQGLRDALEALAGGGWLLPGGELPKLKPGRLPAAASLRARAGPGETLGGDARELALALELCEGRAGFGELLEVLAWGPARLSPAIARLDAAGRIEPGGHAGEAGLRARGRLAGAWASKLDGATWAGWNRARAAHLQRAGATSDRQLPHRCAAGDVHVEAAVETCRELREEGRPERALRLADRMLSLGLSRAGAVDPLWAAELASTWCALGQAELALEAVAPLRSSSDRSTRALVERIDGEVSAQRHAFAAAAAHFERAEELNPGGDGQALLGRAQLLFDARADAELLALFEGLRADAGARQRLTPRAWNNLSALHAMGRFRQGDVEAARTALQEQLEAARDEMNRPRAVSLAINLATLERRAGDLAAARALAEEAALLLEELGNLAGLAQARALLAGILREAGRPREADELFAAALAARERLGDRVGATAVRGMLGLTLADRGHVRAALVELARSSQALDALGRSHDAMLLDARAREMRARLGLEASAPGERESDLAAGDPRTLVALARAALLAGQDVQAADLARRAHGLCERLGLVHVRDEAAQVWRASGGEDAPSAGPSGNPLVEQDRELAQQLAQAPLDEDATLALAEELEARGRDDRAARAWIALSVRTMHDGRARAYALRAEAALAACVAGAQDDERAAQERSLLGVPDPWPEDLSGWRHHRQGEDEQEAEVIELLDINRRLLRQEDLKALLGSIVEHALQVSGAQRGFLVLEEDGHIAVDTALDSRRGGIAESEVELSGSALERALETMKPLRVSNAADDPLLGSAPSVLALDLRSILCVPFRVDQDVRGVIYVDHRLREAAFDERVERVLGLLADQAALAILQVRRLQQIKRLNRELGKKVVRVKTDLEAARRALSAVNLPAPAGGIVGNSPAIHEVRRLIERAAGSKLSVLVTGESGTGKELAARALHELSPRAGGPFVSENCAALPPSLIEAELFGARRGAYTGSDRDREGLFERAHGGTLFLDEVGELPLELQAKLLRVLETSQVRRVGSEHALQVDFRLVVATNRDLEQEVRAERFRSDLYYRINGMTLRMPTLAERVEDIPLLIEHFLRLQAEEEGVVRKLGKPVLKRLLARSWPGNVRELSNEVARLCVLSEGDIEDPDLVSSSQVGGARGPIATGEVVALADLERRAIEHALEVTRGDKTEAAKLLGISRAKVYQRLKEWS